jgi:hypothetical protein
MKKLFLLTALMVSGNAMAACDTNNCADPCPTTSCTVQKTVCTVQPVCTVEYRPACQVMTVPACTTSVCSR